MRTVKRIMIFAATGIVFMSSGCAEITQPAKEIRQYTLEYPSPDFEGLKALPFSIRVDFFRASPDYAGRQMVYRSADFSREAYIYHRWRSSPAQMLEYLLMRDLRNSRLFEVVSGSGQYMETTHVLSGMVDAFLELEEKSVRTAFLSITLMLRHTGYPEADRMHLFQKNYQIRVRLKDGGPKALARAMSQAAAQFSRKAITDIYGTLTEEKKEN
jgi:ABC-type uncharacterized transport system auxiliary subunit